MGTTVEAKTPSSGSRRFRRCVRFLFWTVVIAGGVPLLYLSLVGVPQFIKDQLQTELRFRGIQLELGRVRLRGFRTFLIEHVALGKSWPTNSPQLVIDRAELRLDGRALSRFDLQPESIHVRRGWLLWPLPGANIGTTGGSETNQFTVEDITTELRFASADEWHLEYLRGKLRNADVEISGRILNATALRKLRSGAPADSRPDWLSQTRRIIEQIQKIEFAGPAVLSVHIDGDGRHPNSFRAFLSCQLSGAHTRWGKLETLKLAAIISPAVSNQMTGQIRLSCARLEGDLGRLKQVDLTGKLKWSLTKDDLDVADFQLNVSNAITRWADADSLQLTAETIRTDTVTPATHRAQLTIHSRKARVQTAHAADLQLTANVDHSIHSWRPARGGFDGMAQEISSEWGQSQDFRISGRFHQRSTIAGHGTPSGNGSDSPADGSSSESSGELKTGDWGPFRFLEPFVVETECELAKVESPNVRVDRLALNSRWNSPEFTIQKLGAELYGGRFDSTARLNAATRELRSQAQFNFDVHQIAGLLTTNAQRWLKQFAWESPPAVKAEARFFLPAWTNQSPNWRKDVLPTIELAGEFESRGGSFRDIPVNGARSRFSMTNQFWRLPDLTVIRPEGTASLDYQWSMPTQDYYWKIESGIDITALRPVLDPPGQKVLDDLQVKVPPRVRAEIWGRWHDRSRIGFQADVVATNFVFRGEECTSLSSTVQFTNVFFRFSNIRIQSGNQQVTAEAAGFDPSAHVFFVTNGISTADPDRVTRMIGPKTHAALKPYQFQDPPTVVVNGRFPTASKAEADARFQIVGKTFQYWKFRVPDTSADVHWHGDSLSISNLTANFYNGKLNWQGEFDFSVPHKGADFQFHGRVTRADLGTLAADLTGKTNHLDGLLTGNFAITSASSEQPESWTGHGNLRLRDGFLWNIPVFGVFSPILDKVVPGVANSKVTSGSAGFRIQQGIIHTDNLELRSPAVRLQYEGEVNLKGNVNARVQAEILRDAWAVGRIVSLALWPVTKIFEYKITGTINEPKSEPLYLPKFVLWPLQPFRTMKQIIEAPDESEVR